MVPMIPGKTSPRKSAKMSQTEMAKKNSYKQKEENNKNAINAEYNNLKNQNIVPERIEIAPKTFRNCIYTHTQKILSKSVKRKAPR